MQDLKNSYDKSNLDANFEDLKGEQFEVFKNQLNKV